MALETAVTKDINPCGAAVYTELAADVGSFVRFSCNRYDATEISIVRGPHIGKGGVSRIKLEFINISFPIELIA